MSMHGAGWPRPTARSLDISSSEREGFSEAEPHSLVVFTAFSHTGCTNAPLPAVSHTAKRTHDLPVASNGIEKCFVPKAPRLVAETIWRSIFLPSPHTTSMNDSGNVHSTSAPIVRWTPLPATA